MKAGCRVAGVCVLVGVLGACQTPPKTPEDAVRAANQQDTEEVHTELVRQMIAQRKFYAARAHLDALALEYGETPEILLLQADCMRHLGEVPQARAIYQALLDGPYGAEAAHGMGLLLAGDHLDIALGYLERAVNLRPTQATTRNDLGYAMILAGQYDNAFRQLATAMELAPVDQRAPRNMILLHYVVGNREQADSLADDNGVPEAERARLQEQAARLVASQHGGLGGS